MRAVTARLAELLGGEVTLEQLKAKPGRRTTLRARTERRTVIVKLYESARAGVVAERIGALSAGPPEPCVPRVLLVDPALHMMVLSEVTGHPLGEHLIACDLAGCKRAGAALGTWHSAWRGKRPAPLLAHTADRELEVLRRQSTGAPAVLGAEVRRAARGLGAPWPVGGVVHRDLYEEQVLLGDAVGLIDLDDAALGPPELDIGNLIGHIELLALGRATPLDRPEAALLDGYGSTGPPLDHPLLERCRKLTLLRLACIHHKPALLTVAADARF